MQDWWIPSGPSEAVLLFEAGKLPEARQALDGLIKGFRASTSARASYLTATCLVDRATVLRSANEWWEALQDLADAESLAVQLSSLVRGPLLINIHLIRAKLLARPGTPVFDVQSAKREL